MDLFTNNIILTLILFFTNLIYQCHSANILFVFTGGTYSHDISVWPIAVRLADKHSVTFYSAHPNKPWIDPRVKVISPPQIQKINSGYLANTLQLRLRHKEATIWDSVTTWSHEICEYILTDPHKPESKELFQDVKFDLVILDAILCDCGYIIAYFHKAKVIVYDSTSVMPWFHDIFGFSPESSWVPAANKEFNFPMTLWNTFENYLEPVLWTYHRRTKFYPKMEALMQQLMQASDVPSFLELERQAQLIFVNTHVSVELPRSIPPNVIEIGGTQMWGQKNATISKTIQDFIDTAQDGIILLAFGSSVDFSSIPEFIEKAFFDAFMHFPKINFVAKAGLPKPDGAPRNLMYEKWIPQKEILAHPKTLACITHGGLNGIIEATHLGIPLITIPIFGEQDYQAYKLQARGSGIRLEMRELTAEKLIAAISNITEDPRYRQNMQNMMIAFRDRPMPPLEVATYWVEYVLRHNDMSFLNPVSYQPWTLVSDHLFSRNFYLTILGSFATVLFCSIILFKVKFIK